MMSERQEDQGLDKIHEPVGEPELIKDENDKIAEVSEESEAPVTVSKEELENLHKELEEAHSKANEYLDGWQRSRAEFTNYKKRMERDQAQTYQVAAGNIVRRFLEVWTTWNEP